MKINGQDGIKTLIFDFGGVFLDLDLPRCIQCFKEIGFADIADYLTPHLQGGIFGKLDCGQVSPAQFRSEIRAAVGRPLADSQIDNAWTSMLAGIPQYKLDFAKQIKPNFNRVVLLSNINEIDWLYAKDKWFSNSQNDLNACFDKTYLSYEMKVMKPSPEIFERLLKKEGCDPSECFLVDDAKVNCDMAESLGIRAYAPKPYEDWRHIFS